MAGRSRLRARAGLLNDAISIYVADATLASAFVARWFRGQGRRLPDAMTWATMRTRQNRVGWEPYDTAEINAEAADQMPHQRPSDPSRTAVHPTAGASGGDVIATSVRGAMLAPGTTARLLSTLSGRLRPTRFGPLSATSILMTLALRGHKSRSSLHTAPASRLLSNRFCRL